MVFNTFEQIGKWQIVVQFNWHCIELMIFLHYYNKGTLRLQKGMRMKSNLEIGIVYGKIFCAKLRLFMGSNLFFLYHNIL